VFGGVGSGKPRRSGLVVSVAAPPRESQRVDVFKRDDRFGVLPGMKPLAYGAFPLRATAQPLIHGQLSEIRGTFRLALAYSGGVKDDVDAALWAWAHFGGLGARTRRGFGAISQVSEGLISIEDGFTQFVKHAGLNAPWPHLATRPVLSHRTFGGAGAAHEALLQALARLRQSPELGRNPGHHPGRPGRSRWPEADATRALTGQAAAEHAVRTVVVDKFPRAKFGLPIILHFKDRGDPADAQLQARDVHGQVLDRWASPLLLRPHRRANQVHAMALRLAGPVPAQFILIGRGGPHAISVGLTSHEAGRIHPLNKRGQTFTDPIERYFEEIK
jgi:CRISPR-associated protein Cmr1